MTNTQKKQAINPANLRRLADATADECHAIFDNNEMFRTIVKAWLYRNDVDYYLQEIFASCFRGCAEWYEASPGDVRFYVNEGPNARYADFVDGLEKAQKGYGLLPDSMKPELELLYRVRSDWANCVDPEKDDDLYDTMKTMCDNFAETIEEIVTEALNYYADHPDEVRTNATDYIDCVGDSVFFDRTTYHLFRITEYVEKEDYPY